MKIGCLIYFYGRKYEKLGSCAMESFKKFHPDITLFHVNKNNREAHGLTAVPDTGASKYMLAYEIMIKHKLDKIIILGADTITCARLNEFLDDNEHDILASLDYPYYLVDNHMLLTPTEETHLNADVICFNNLKAIRDIIKKSPLFPAYAEQGALNYVVWSNDYKYSCKIVDGPYLKSKVVYNVRSKGNMCLPKGYHAQPLDGPGKPAKFSTYEKPWGPHLNKFYVQDKKLYTKDHKQIKVWHYCDGFGNLSEENFVKLMNNYIFKWFSEDAKKYFTEHCACGDFFEKEFTL